MNNLPHHLPRLRLMCTTRAMVVPLLVLLVAVEASKWPKLPCGEVAPCTSCGTMRQETMADTTSWRLLSHQRFNRKSRYGRNFTCSWSIDVSG